MPSYRLFCLARPGMALDQQAAVIRTAALAVLDGGGVVMDLRSFGDKPLAYPVRPAGQRFDDVRPGLICLPHSVCSRHAQKGHLSTELQAVTRTDFNSLSAGAYVAALLQQPSWRSAAADTRAQGRSCSGCS